MLLSTVVNIGTITNVLMTHFKNHLLPAYAALDGLFLLNTTHCFHEGL